MLTKDMFQLSVVRDGLSKTTGYCESGPRTVEWGAYLYRFYNQDPRFEGESQAEVRIIGPDWWNGSNEIMEMIIVARASEWDAQGLSLYHGIPKAS